MRASIWRYCASRKKLKKSHIYLAEKNKTNGHKVVTPPPPLAPPPSQTPSDFSTSVTLSGGEVMLLEYDGCAV